MVGGSIGQVVGVLLGVGVFDTEHFAPVVKLNSAPFEQGGVLGVFGLSGRVSIIEGARYLMRGDESETEEPERFTF